MFLKALGICLLILIVILGPLYYFSSSTNRNKLLPKKIVLVITITVIIWTVKSLLQTLSLGAMVELLSLLILFPTLPFYLFLILYFLIIFIDVFSGKKMHILDKITLSLILPVLLYLAWFF